MLTFCLIIGYLLLKDSAIGIKLLLEFLDETVLLLVLLVIVHRKRDLNTWIFEEKKLSSLNQYIEHISFIVGSQMKYVQTPNRLLILVLTRKSNPN